MNYLGMVKEFMSRTKRQFMPSVPTVPDGASRELRVKLMLEEVLEFACSSGVQIHYNGREYQINAKDNTGIGDFEFEAMPEQNAYMVGVADAIADSLYVTFGAAAAWGLDIAPIFAEVHYANMEKFGPGGYEREDGKWIKPPDWQPPNIQRHIDAQLDVLDIDDGRS